MTVFGRVLVLAGAALIAACVFLHWVTVRGVPLHLDWLGTRVSTAGRTVSGRDVTAGPYLLGLAGLLAVLGLLGLARRLVLALGVLTMAGAGALLYYLFHVIDIETAHRSLLERGAADLLVDSSVGPGAFVLLAGGVCVFLGALPRRR